MPGKTPYDGHTVNSQIEILGGATPKIAHEDRFAAASGQRRQSG